MPSGLARWLGCALIVLATSCDPFTYGERTQLSAGDGGATIDDSLVVGDIAPPADTPIEGGPDAMVPDAMVPDAMDDAMDDASVPDASLAPDAGLPPDASVPPDASIPPDAAPPSDGGPGDGSLSDALSPDARPPPGLPVGGSHDDQIKSFYACSTGDGASALPLLLAILALRRRRR